MTSLTLSDVGGVVTAQRDGEKVRVKFTSGNGVAIDAIMGAKGDQIEPAP